jgi:hypothetical protein
MRLLPIRRRHMIDPTHVYVADLADQRTDTSRANEPLMCPSCVSEYGANRNADELKEHEQYVARLDPAEQAQIETYRVLRRRCLA